MLAIRNLLKVNNQIFKNVAQQRNMSVIATPARKKISMGVSLRFLPKCKPSQVYLVKFV